MRDRFALSSQRLVAQSAEKAIPILLAEHGDMIYAMGLQLCGDPQAAEDLVQETFMRAFRNWDQFEGRSKPSTWLYTIASRTCTRMQRRRAGEPRSMEPITDLIPARDALPELSVSDPLSDVIQDELRETVREALRRLPIRYRLPLVLKEMGGFSVAEVGRIMHLTEGTVKSRLHRARLKLGHELASALPTTSDEAVPHSRDDCLTAITERLSSAFDGAAPADDRLCSRCESVFGSVALARRVCTELTEGRLSDRVRELLLAELSHQA